MKNKIKKVLDKYADSQMNLGSDVARNILAQDIYEAITAEDDKGDPTWLDENDKTSEYGGV